MAATEASPVGNDMETVETQLAQHEVYIPFSIALATTACLTIVLALEHVQ